MSESVAWTACLDCGKRVTGDSIHTCSPQLKELTDEEIYEVWKKAMQEEAKIEYSIYATQLERQPFLYFARAILRKAQEK
jgi:hypothetical protein